MKLGFYPPNQIPIAKVAHGSTISKHARLVPDGIMLAVSMIQCFCVMTGTTLKQAFSILHWIVYLSLSPLLCTPVSPYILSCLAHLVPYALKAPDELLALVASLIQQPQMGVR